MHPVHGLVLHQLSLQQRPLLYRAALSEMIVPYGDWRQHARLEACTGCVGVQHGNVG